jgi:ketosteroid isomerase-like protein
MKQILIITFLAIITLNAAAQNKDVQTIKSILNAQTKQWNAGNLEAFMTGYWQNDSLLFIGNTGPKYGYNTTLENYKKSYPDTAHMGKLSFDIVSVKMLSPAYYFVVGKWFLKRSVGHVGGMYTLLFRKINGKWLIVVDHSS